MAKAELKETKVQIQNILGSTLDHSGIIIESGEVVLAEQAMAKELIEKGYCKEIVAKVL